MEQLKTKILIVEDEEKIARLLEIELTYEGYETGKALDGLEGLDMIREQSWDLVLLDVMLPSLSGIEVLRRIRAHDQKMPVILLTAKDSVEDKVSGLDLGANDYLTKPFQIEELFARIRAALRLTKQQNDVTMPEDWLKVGNLKLSEATREVYRGDDTIDLTPREFDLLTYLMKNEKIVLNREQLLNGVWGYDYYGDTNIVDVYIRYLRNKVDKPYDHALIHTVRGVGYVLKDKI
ncbi:response regulator transcription factor [Lederbergia galactosidilytica]|uniref:PhoB family transcriptional regulator n=1 Tax=Lederbergia galactosidilytica TaxID=217031 RepID=A0A177ZY46_9BACI|nr:response regulator transcription factor [Lederbergia galactosidilytica]KRG12428.1 PhoB family transcriptional regulator [Virgibacillus soli]OAK72230.1 PhoB family transcriptional regulator [Lederbergia galactosidilytica]